MNRKLKIESKIDNLRIVEIAIDEITSEIGLNQDNYGKIIVSTMEAVNNAIIHGNKSDVSKQVEIEISYKRKILRISVSDEGKGFRPKEIPDPTKPENIESLSGRGVFLMSRLADKIEFNEQGNKVTMYFKDIKT
ncbi:MAG: ATP-binding protein [Odoribacter sp.]|nr:ATP-binding protein [Odoribacter sp.]